MKLPASPMPGRSPGVTWHRIATRWQTTAAALLLSLTLGWSSLTTALVFKTDAEAIQAAYLAYYARSGDPAGVSYWSLILAQHGGSLEAIIAAFSRSDEFIQRYPASLGNVTLVETVYQQLFGRTADAVGLAFYAAALDAGTITRDRLMFDILSGVSGEDVTVLDHKLSVSAAFTAAVAASGAVYDATTMGENIDLLATVGADPASVTTAQTLIDGYVAQHAATPWNPPNLVTIDPANPPTDLFSADERERLHALRDTKSLSFIGQASADGATILGVIANTNGAEIGLWDLERIEFMPLPFPAEYSLKFSAWIDDDRLRVIFENTAMGNYHLGLIDRRDGGFSIETQALPIAGDLRALSPNGQRVVVTSALETATAMPPLAATQASDAEALSGAQGGQRRVRMLELPTGLSASTSSTSSGNLIVTGEPALIQVFDLETQLWFDLMTVPATSSLEGISFSQHGHRLAVVENDFINHGLPINANTNAPIASLTSLITQDALGLIPPAENPYHLNSRLTLFDLSGSSPTSRSIAASELPVAHAQFGPVPPSWSPAGERFVATVNVPASLTGRDYPTFIEPQSIDYLVLDSELRIIHEIQDSPINFPYPHFMPPTTKPYWIDEDALLFLSIHQADQVLYRYDLATSQRTEIRQAATIAQLELLPRDNGAVMVRSDASQAPELWRMNLNTGEAWALTTLNAAATQAARVVAYPVEFTLDNGDRFSGYWFAPSSMSWPPSQEPVIFWQQGGPGGPMLSAWGDTVESPLTLLPTFGISILMVPLQQRPGNTPENWNALVDGDNFGRVDIDAMAEIARQLVSRGWASPQGLGLTGCSYGGYMTSQSIVRYPDLWVAANPQCSFVDAISEFQSSLSTNANSSRIAYLMGTTPWENWAHYIDASPGYHGDQVQAATLIFQGTKDFLPVSIMENFFYNIHTNGLAEVRMLRFLGEGHGLQDPQSQIYAAQEQILWFREHLASH